jgi:hypothetical protein
VNRIFFSDKVLYVARFPMLLAAVKIARATAGLVCKVRHYTFHDAALFSLFQRITQVAVVGMNKSASAGSAHAPEGHRENGEAERII